MIDLLQCSLGMELGSTRIKAVLIDASYTPLAQGDFTWENRLQNGIWTYPMEEVRQGVQAAYAALAADVRAKHGMALLAAYRLHRRDGETLADYLQTRVFAGASGETVTPSPADKDGFAAFLAQYKTALQAERALTE